LKHANPSVVSLSLSEAKGVLTMRYKDDGCGFENLPLNKEGKTQGMGFNNIISRTKSLKGSYSIQTALGQGFSVEFHFPLP